MKCAEAKQLFSPMLDSVLEHGRRQELDQHLGVCQSCVGEYETLRRTKRFMATMEPHPAPPELALCIQAALSQHLAARRPNRWERCMAQWKNALNSFIPLTAGLLSAVLIFGLLINGLVPAHLSNSNDVPTTLYTPPEMTAAPFGVSSGSNANILVEAIIDAHGRMQDYRVLNPSGQNELSPEMKNALIFARFRPATSFGMPTSGRVVISFSNINVGG